MKIQEELLRNLTPRPQNSHKGDYGRVFILAGSKKYSGAAYLTALAALRGGAGLVTLAVPDCIHAIVARRQPELIIEALPSSSEGGLAAKALKTILKSLKDQDVLALGPGLGTESGTVKLVRDLVKKTSLPVVLDADGLNAFRKEPGDLRFLGGRGIITPHPGEFTRLFGGKLSHKDSERIKRAAEISKRLKLVVVLKGHRTVVADPSGETYVNKTGNAGMATAGSGDVLTGIIAAFLGQGFSPWDAARFAVYLHGTAGDLAAKELGELSLIAGDLIEFFPKAVLKTGASGTNR